MSIFLDKYLKFSQPSRIILIEYIKDMSRESRLISNINKAFITGLYPKLKRACEEYRIRAKIIVMSNKDEVRKNSNVQKKMKEALLSYNAIKSIYSKIILLKILKKSDI